MTKISASLGTRLDHMFKEQDASSFEFWMTNRIKNKMLIAVESLLEGSTDHYVLKKLVKGIPLSVLKQNIVWIYDKSLKLYGNNYTHEAFDHADMVIDHSELGSSKYRQRAEFIIEIGFRVFILMNYILEINENEVDDLELEVLVSAFCKDLKEAIALARENSGSIGDLFIPRSTYRL